MPLLRHSIPTYRRPAVFGSHPSILNANVSSLPPLRDGLGIDAISLRQRSYAYVRLTLTILDCSTHCLCRSGAAVKYLSHNASRSLVSSFVPVYSGTKQLMSSPSIIAHCSSCSSVKSLGYPTLLFCDTLVPCSCGRNLVSDTSNFTLQEPSFIFQTRSRFIEIFRRCYVELLILPPLACLSARKAPLKIAEHPIAGANQVRIASCCIKVSNCGAVTCRQ